MKLWLLVVPCVDIDCFQRTDSIWNCQDHWENWKVILGWFASWYKLSKTYTSFAQLCQSWQKSNEWVTKQDNSDKKKWTLTVTKQEKFLASADSEVDCQKRVVDHDVPWNRHYFFKNIGFHVSLSYWLCFKTCLHTARVSVRKMDTLWMVTVKLMWKNMKRAQNIENYNKIEGENLKFKDWIIECTNAWRCLDPGFAICCKWAKSAIIRNWLLSTWLISQPLNSMLPLWHKPQAILFYS